MARAKRISSSCDAPMAETHAPQGPGEDRVDVGAPSMRRAYAVEQRPARRQTLMVLVDESADAVRLVRLGKRLAELGDVPWLVAHVNRAHGSGTGLDGQLASTMRLAEELGANTLLLSGDDLVCRVCRAPRPTSRRYSDRRRPIEEALSNDDLAPLPRKPFAAPRRRHRHRRCGSRGGRRTGSAADSSRQDACHRGRSGYAEAVLATAFCAALAWLLSPALETANLGLVFLTGVLFAAVRGGVGPALLASALSFLVFNYLLTEPRYTFHVSSRRRPPDLGVFLRRLPGHGTARGAREPADRDHTGERPETLIARGLQSTADRKRGAGRPCLRARRIPALGRHAGRDRLVPGLLPVSSRSAPEIPAATA